MRLLNNWADVLRRSWTIRVAAFWGALGALLAAWPGLAGELPAWAYALGAVLLGGSVAVARLLKQPGADL